MLSLAQSFPQSRDYENRPAWFSLAHQVHSSQGQANIKMWRLGASRRLRLSAKSTMP